MDGNAERVGELVRDRFDSWAQVLFAILATVAIVVTVVVVAAAPASDAQRLTALVLGIVVAGLLVIAIVGLGSRRPWARPFAVLICCLVTIEGALTFARALSDGRIDIPIGAFLAIAVLAQRRGPVIDQPLADRDRSTLAILAVVQIASWTWGVIAAPLMMRG